MISARTIILVGLGVGIAASGAAALWLHEQPPSSAPAVHNTTAPAKRGMSSDLETLAAEVKRWQGETQSALTALRAQLARVNRAQDVTGQQLDQLAETVSRTGGEGATVPARDEGAEAAALTPEQEREREAARAQAELTLMDGTLRAEQPDPAWARTAQLALQTTFHQEALPGVELVDAECRATLCRMELAVDDTIPQDSLRNLLNLAPWSAPTYVQIDTETGAAVMYLAREEHTLPQLGE
jgi:hypothetical protein